MARRRPALPAAFPAAARAAALALAAAAAAPAAAQPVACAFTLVCAPEIDCEPHGGIPFEIAHDPAAGHSVTVDGVRLPGQALPVPGAALSLAFAGADQVLLFTLSPGGDGVLTRHRLPPGAPRPETASFLGPCRVA